MLLVNLLIKTSRNILIKGGIDTLTGKFFLFLFLIYGFLLFGYVMKRINIHLSDYSKPLTKIFLIFFTSIIGFNALWSIRLDNIRMIIIPFMNIGMMSFSFIPAFVLSKLLKLSKNETGSMISCIAFSNWGITLGGFLCLLLYGKEGLYIASWYIVFCRPFQYFVGFPILSMYSEERKITIKEASIELVKNPASIVPISFMVLGIVLNLIQLARPELLNIIATRWLTYPAAAGFSFAIGLGINLNRSRNYVKHSLLICLVKFLYNPLIGLLLLFLFGYLRMENIIPSKVIFIESFMPTAIVAVAFVKIFNLNEDLANAAWIITSLALVPMIPVIFYLQSLL